MKTNLAIILMMLYSLVAFASPMPSQSDTSRAALYEVHKDGRIYLFYDTHSYHDFKQTGHVNYMFSRIGAGPKGETLVFGLTGKDKKKRSGIPSVMIYDGEHKPTSFYGEAILEGRIYVFDDYREMQTFRQTGEAAYRFTDIGSGPNGETVVFVLTKQNKKKRPDALVKEFKHRNAIN